MMIGLTVLYAACTALAAVSMTAGNPAAINGVIGAGICTVACAALAWLDHGT
jgi:hypothetical protein